MGGIWVIPGKADKGIDVAFESLDSAIFKLKDNAEAKVEQRQNHPDPALIPWKETGRKDTWKAKYIVAKREILKRLLSHSNQKFNTHYMYI